MMINLRLNLFLLVVFLSAPHIAAQQIDSGAHPGQRIYLDAVVSPFYGPPVSNLQQQDFTIFDNNVPQTITSFEAIDGSHAQISLIVVLDALSVTSRVKATALEDIKRFLTADGGELAYPTTVDFVTAKGLEFEAGPSRDGKAIAASLNKHATAIRNNGDIAGPRERENQVAVSFQAFAELVALERDNPGRKIILWVSPGWPPVVPPDYEHKASEKQVQQVRLQKFGNIVQLAKQLREGQITVYSIEPPALGALGDLDSGFTNGRTHLRPSHSDADVAGVGSPSEVRWDDLGLEALALRSGGLALYPGNDLASSLRECLAHSSPFYELSFDPVLTNEPNHYHQLKVEVAKPGLTARTRQGYYSQPWPGPKFAAEARNLGQANGAASSQDPATDDREAPDAGSLNSSPQTPTYVDMPLQRLIKRIPALKGVQPTEDQKQLPMILERTGHSVDDFIHNIGDLIANEDVTQEKLNANGKIRGKERVQDDYLILHHGYEWGANAEYRMDKNGKRLGAIGLEKGYLVTAGYALSCISFSTVTQSQSDFRYLGDQKVGMRDAFVLAFAQRPDDATFKTVLRGTGGNDVEVLTQGILWIDKDSFQILRMRSDLLAPNKELRLDQATTDVKFGPVQLQNTPTTLWLPDDVDVFIEIANEKYRNLHHYSNYRRYQVAVKVGNGQ
jgi:VWFA-related protein